MRLFIAIPLSEQIKENVVSLQDSFKQAHVRGNYTPSENLHITLAFIGEYKDPDQVMDALEGIEFSPFTLTMDKVGRWDKLWWAGFRESKELESLARQVRRALADAGIPYDRKKFKAHVTILRKPIYPDGERISQMDLKAGKMQVDRISLMQSTRGRHGMIYTEIGTVTATI